MTVSKNEPERVVLDSHAVLLFLEGADGSDEVRRILLDGEPWMTLVNLGEVAYIVERKYGERQADRIYAQLLADERLNGQRTISWIPVHETLVRRAAGLKAADGLSYADCFTAAAAEILGCPLVTGDREFERAERAGISVRWL